MKITIEYLESLDACEDQIKIFNNTFPEGTNITKAACLKAARADLDIDWIACKVLSETAYEAYLEACAPIEKAYDEAHAPLIKTYYEALAPLDKAYFEALAPLDKAYDEAIAPIDKAYREALSPIDKAYFEALSPIDKAYNEARALAFYNAYRS